MLLGAMPAWRTFTFTRAVLALAVVPAFMHAPEAAAAPAAVPGHLLRAIPDECYTLQELDAWRKYQENQVKSDVPASFQSLPLQHIKEEFNKRFFQLTGRNFTVRRAEAVVDPAHQPRGAADCAAIPADAAVSSDGTTSVVAIPILFMNARMCQKKADLDMWRMCQLEEIQSHIPAAYKDFAFRRVQDQFGKRLMELDPSQFAAQPSLEADDLPVFLIVGMQCESEDELRSWRAYQLHQVLTRVPPEYQEFASGAVEGAFRNRLSELQQDELLNRRPAVPSSSLPHSGRPHSSVLQQASGSTPWRTQLGARSAPLPIAAAAAPGAVGAQPPADTALVAQAATAMPLLASSSAAAMVLMGLAVPSFLAFFASAFRATRRRSVAFLPYHEDADGYYMQTV